MAPTSSLADAYGLLLRTRDGGPGSSIVQTSKGQPLGGAIVSVSLALISASVLSVLFTMRANAIKSWKRLPFVVGILFFIYVDSYFFVLSSAIIQYGVGININLVVCDAAIIICLVFYVTTKAVYLFLVEKAYIIRGTRKERLQSKLYIFNSFGMLGAYAVVVVLNFVFRITRFEDETCIIGMKKIAMIPLISFDALVNVYLTILFLIPLMSLYSFRTPLSTPDMHRPTVKLRTVALRTFIGACCTLASSIVNLTVLMVLDGEPGWVCLMCCNSDILFSALVLYWITSKDNIASTSNSEDAARNESQPQYSPEHRSGSNRGCSNGGDGSGASRVRGSRHDSINNRAAYARCENGEQSCPASGGPSGGLITNLAGGREQGGIMLQPHARVHLGESTEELHIIDSGPRSMLNFDACDKLKDCAVHKAEDVTLPSRRGTGSDNAKDGGASPWGTGRDGDTEP